MVKCMNNENNELFAMLDSNKKNFNNTYKIYREESKQFKKANKINFKLLFTTSLIIGTISVSSLMALEKNTVSLKSEPLNSYDIVQSTQNNSVNSVTYINNLNKDINIENKVVEPALEDKIEKSYNIYENKKLFDVGENPGIYYVNNYINSTDYNYFKKYSKMYGVDPNLMVAIGMQESSLNHDECLPGGSFYNDCAIGIMQLEKGCINELTAFNYETNCYDTISITDGEKCDIDTNIRAACMLFQNAIEKYNGNIFLAIQYHNYNNMLDVALEKTSLEANISTSNLINNYSDIKFLKYIDDIHNNPSKYLSNWQYKTYGDNEYINHVLSYCVSNQVEYMYNGEKISFDLEYGKSVINNIHRQNNH